MKIAHSRNLICAAALCLAATLSSCSLDGSYEQFSPQTELTVVQYTPDSSSWYMLNDAGLKLWPKNASEVRDKPKNNARVLVVFNVLFDEKMPSYDYVVALAYIGHVNTYDVTATDSATLAALPSDSLRNVERVWVGSRYLNVNYFCFYNADEDEHDASLLHDTTALQNGSVKLVLKHDSKGKKGLRTRQSIISFDLESLRSVVQADSFGVTFEAECVNGVYQMQKLSYKFKE
jgi:hypothetical protein